MDTLFRFPVRFLFGEGSLSKIADEALRLSDASKTILLVCGTGYTSTSAGLAQIKNYLETAGFRTVLFAEATPDPPVGLVHRCSERILSSGASLIVAYGGGSPIDLAKAAAAHAANSGSGGPHPGASYLDYLYGRLQLSQPGVPLIAIPTTAGTGSEMSSAAVVTDTAAKSKRGLSSDFFFPKTAIVDPELQSGMGPSLAAATGMDALTHAVESYASKSSTPLTRAIAGESARLVVSSLEKAVSGDARSRSDMAYASSIAGMAFSQSGLGMVHGFAHPIGARAGIAHGLANAVMLARVCGACASDAPGPYAALARLCGLAENKTPDAQAAGILVERIAALAAAIGIPPRLRDAGVSREQLPDILADALGYRGRPMSPKAFSDAELAALLENAW